MKIKFLAPLIIALGFQSAYGGSFRLLKDLIKEQQRILKKQKNQSKTPHNQIPVDVPDEKIVQGQLTELMRTAKKVYYSISEDNGYQIVHACVYTIFNEWQNEYLEILKATPLDNKLISVLNEYAGFAASIQKGEDTLDALYPTLFSNMQLYIGQKRSSQDWPLPSENLALDNINKISLLENLDQCLNPVLINELSPTIATPDLIGAESVIPKVYTATFRKSDSGGIELDISSDSKVSPSDIEDVEVVEGDDSFIK